MNGNAKKKQGTSRRALTPDSVARLMVALLEPDEGMTVYDPACGSGELLLEVGRYLARNGKNPEKVSLYGEENAPLAADMPDAYLGGSGIQRSFIRRGSPLTDPQFTLIGRRHELCTFDRVIANPQFSLSLSSADYERWKSDPFGRNRYGYPPRTRTDFAYVLHMLASLKDGGRMVILLPYGALFRSGAEARIRAELIKNDLLEAVVGLGTATKTKFPVVALVFQRGKAAGRRGHVLILDGTLRQGPSKPRPLSEEDSNRLVNNVASFSNITGSCRVVTSKEVEMHGFNLHFDRYLTIEHTLQLPTPRANDGKASSARSPRSTTPATDEVMRARTALYLARRQRDEGARALLTRGLGETRIRETHLGPVPEHWIMVPLDDVLVEQGRRNGINKREGSLDALYLKQTTISLDGKVNVQSAERVKLRTDDWKRCQLQSQDVLMRRVDGSRDRCGKSALLLDVSCPMVCASGVIRLRANRNRIEPVILLHWLHMSDVREYLVSKMNCSGKASINQENLQTLHCPHIKDDAERQTIANRLRALDDAVHDAARNLSRLDDTDKVPR